MWAACRDEEMLKKQKTPNIETATPITEKVKERGTIPPIDRQNFLCSKNRFLVFFFKEWCFLFI
jgi:hypothetical protein